MNPSVTLRFRRATAALAVAWALVALVTLVWSAPFSDERLGPPFFFAGVATDPWRIDFVAPSAAEAGVRRGDRLVAIDGGPPERAIADWSRRFSGDRLNLYRIETPTGEVFDLALRPVPASQREPPFLSPVCAGLAVVGLLYLGVGMAVWRMRPGRAEAWALLVFCSAMATNLFLAPPRGDVGWRQAWIDLPLLGASGFHLFTLYPAEASWVVRYPGCHAAAYAAAFALGVLSLLEGTLGAPAGSLKVAAFSFSSLLALFSFASLARERMRVRDSRIAERADIMLLGALVSFLPVIAVAAAQPLLPTSLPWYVALLWVFLFPLAVAYGIVRKDLFEVRRLARSSVAYGAATLAITGVYAFLITMATAEFSRFHVNARSPWFTVSFLFLAILVFNPLLKRMQRLVDRLFARDRAPYARAVREISEAMVSMLSVKEVVDRILVALTDTMGVERALVLLRDEQSEVLATAASRGDWEEDALAPRLPPEHPVCVRLRESGSELVRSDFDDEPDPELREMGRDVFDTLEVELIVPILFGSDLVGALAVGRRLSGERFSAEDRQLVRTLANQSAVAIENAKAFDEIARLNETLEARVEERTRELQETQSQLLHSEKMKSLGQLVAGIAHELNNPIGFVYANLKLLDEFVARLVQQYERGEEAERTRHAIERLLARSREGTERLKKIVEDLRVFSRTDRAELEEADLNREIDRTLSLMEPHLKAGVRVERDYEELPPVRCHAGQLGQVFMNLLMNAADAMGGQGLIRIRTRRCEGGVRVEFEDDGPGIAPEVLGRIFEPFFTTKPVGVGTGLGLSLSHGIVQRHGGRIWAESQPGEGARFVIELPLDATQAAA